MNFVFYSIDTLKSKESDDEFLVIYVVNPYGSGNINKIKVGGNNIIKKWVTIPMSTSPTTSKDSKNFIDTIRNKLKSSKLNTNTEGNWHES